MKTKEQILENLNQLFEKKYKKEKKEEMEDSDKEEGNEETEEEMDESQIAEKLSKEDIAHNKKLESKSLNKLTRIVDKYSKELANVNEEYGKGLEGEMTDRDNLEVKFSKKIKSVVLKELKKYGIS